MGERLVCDTETNGLLDAVSTLHMIQVGTLEGEDVTIYTDFADPAEIARARAGVMLGDVELKLTCPIRPLAEGIERLRAADETWFHNLWGYDWWIGEKFFPGVLQRTKGMDTLVAARLLGREFDNSLEAWGRRLNCHKGKFNGPWDHVTAEMLAYSQQDIPAGRALARHLMGLLPGSERAFATEQSVAYWIARQEHTGFHLDEPKARELHIDLQVKLRTLEQRVRAEFPARWKSLGVMTPRRADRKHGYTKDVPFSRVVYEEFSLGSRQMIAGRLQELGWKPSEFTAGGQPTIDEDVLQQLSRRFPVAALLADYFDTAKQAGFVEGWLEKARNGKVHGRVNTLGAYTHRMSHKDPNMAQIPKHGPYRQLWKPRPGWKLVGCDGEGIQSRVLAHYTYAWNKGSFARILEAGRKEDRTDIHSVNAIACDALFPAAMDFKHRRDTVKNCFYAIFFNARDPRLGQTLKDGIAGYARLKPPRIPNRELGAAVRRGLETSLVGLSACIELVEKTFEKRKFLRGLDGRKLVPNGKRNSLMTIIQGGEAVIMKTALAIFGDEAVPANGWAYDTDWAFVANVHDEVQMECRPELAEVIGAAFAGCIEEAGRRLELKCAFAGAFDIGDDWSQTH